MLPTYFEFIRRPLQLATIATLSLLLLGVHAFATQSVAPAPVAEMEGDARFAINRILGEEDTSYHVLPDVDGYRVDSQAQGLQARFDVDGVQVGTESVSWDPALGAWGYGETWQPIAVASPQVDLNRVEFQHGAISEWYINGPLGLQQGFTLNAAPGANLLNEALTLVLSSPQDHAVTLDTDRMGLHVWGTNDEQLHYSGLMAYDANGQMLPVWMELRDGRVLLRVEDGNAAYPLTIDPLIEFAKLSASDGEANDALGTAVAIDGDTVVIGAAGDKIGTNNRQGSAYVFVKPSGGWASTTTFDAKLTASDGTASDAFGTSVAISGDTIVIGAPEKGVGAKVGQGSVYVFVKPGGGWVTTDVFTAKLTASDGEATDKFGTSVSISGDTIAIGTPFDDNGATADQGSAYVFVKPGGGWTTTDVFTAKLTASDGAATDEFGMSVSISGDTLATGAPLDDSGATADQGSAYVFVKPGGGWATTSTFTAKLTASDGAATDEFGRAVALDGDTLAIGASRDTVGANGGQGSVYVFVKPGGGWATTSTFTAKLTASDGATNDEFGTSVDISGDTLLAGAPLHNTNANNDRGAVYEFVKPGGGWASTSAFTTKLIASDGDVGDKLGSSVSIDNGTSVLGAAGDTVGANGKQGSAYIFREPNLAPTDIALSNNSVAENQISGTTVGTFNSTDPDVSNTFTYTLAAGTGSSGNASFAISGATLQTNAVFDFETQNSYSIRVRTTDQGGLFYEEVFTINITDVNDAPVLDNSGAMTLASINEDDVSSAGTLVTTIIASAGGDRITDQDSGALEGIALIGVDATNGAWEYSINGGTNWSSVGAVSNAAARLLAANANTRVRFVPNADFNGTVNITFRAWDQTSGTNGATGDAGTNGGTTAYSSAVETASITVNAVNDAPVLDNSGVMTLASINEDDVNSAGTLVTSIIASAGADRITDVDSGALEGIALIGVDVSNGTWEYSINGGTNWSNVGAVSNTAARLLAANANTRIRFVPNTDFDGTVDPGITFRAWDQTSGTNGATGNASVNGGTTAFSGVTETAAITVNGINDAPVNNMPGDQTTPENVSLVFSTGDGNAISIADVDAGLGEMQVVLTVTQGTLTLNSTSGLSFTTGDGTDDASMVFTGSIADINSAFEGMVFTPTTNFDGTASLEIRTDDQGNSGSGGALFDVDAINIDVDSVNDAPINNLPGSQTTPEDVPLVLSSGTGNAISITDIDAVLGQMRVELTATHGALTLSGTSGLVFSLGDGTGDTTLAFTGTRNNINAALNGMSFAPDADYNGAASVRIYVNDQGNTGSGGPLSDDDTLDIDVTAVNDAPHLDLNGSDVGTNYSTAFTAGGPAVSIVNSTGLSLTDIDSPLMASAKITLTNILNAGQEVLAANTTGTSITAAYNSTSGVLTLSGSDSRANYQKVLRTVTYRNTAAQPNNSAARLIRFSVNDGGLNTNVATSEVSIPNYLGLYRLFLPMAVRNFPAGALELQPQVRSAMRWQLWAV